MGYDDPVYGVSLLMFGALAMQNDEVLMNGIW